MTIRSSCWTAGRPAFAGYSEWFLRTTTLFCRSGAKLKVPFPDPGPPPPAPSHSPIRNRRSSSEFVDDFCAPSGLNSNNRLANASKGLIIFFLSFVLPGNDRVSRIAHLNNEKEAGDLAR